jgi:hypothetical protein
MGGQMDGSSDRGHKPTHPLTKLGSILDHLSALSLTLWSTAMPRLTNSITG